MRSSAALLVGVLLLVSPLVAAGADRPADDPVRSVRGVPDASTGVEPPSSTSSEVGVTPNPPSEPTASNVTVRDGTEMHVLLRENGNARWTVTVRFVLNDQNETAAFREIARRYERGTSNVGVTRETFERVAERASADTDRRMAIRNVNRSGRVLEGGTVGVLSLSFTWTNFTRVEDDRISLGDAFWFGSETWLPALTEDQRLVIRGPSGYYVSSSNVAHNGVRIEYEGPRKFERGDFSVTYRPRSPASTTRTTSPRTDDTTTGEGFPDFSGTSGLVVVLLLFGLGGSAYAWSQRRDVDETGAESDADSDGTRSTPPLADDAETGPGGVDDAETGPGRVDDAETGPGEVDEPEDDTEEDDADQPPTELLSDEERVLRLLRDNDGRMKQAQIVKETNWSNAKVSQLLSKMEENDAVDKLRIGRENLITLPDEDVADIE